MTEIRNGEIVIHHINIRQSISILLAKVVTIDIISATLIAIAYFILSTSSYFFGIQLTFNILNIFIFSCIALFKIGLTLYAVLEWLNEYYEITPENIFHRKGIFYKKEERVKLSSIDTVELEQEIFGRLFKYGTIDIYNYRKDKLMSLFLIHNPTRYQRILEELVPSSDEAKKTVGGDMFSGSRENNFT